MQQQRSMRCQAKSQNKLKLYNKRKKGGAALRREYNFFIGLLNKKFFECITSLTINQSVAYIFSTK